MTAHVLIVQDEHDRLYGPTKVEFNTTDEAVVYAKDALACNCKGEVLAVFDEDGEEVEVGASGVDKGDDKPPAHSATKAEWQEYADSHGVQYPSDASKADIIARVEGK